MTGKVEYYYGAIDLTDFCRVVVAPKRDGLPRVSGRCYKDGSYSLRIGNENAVNERLRGSRPTSLWFRGGRYAYGPVTVFDSDLDRSYPPQSWARMVMPAMSVQRVIAFFLTGNQEVLCYDADAAGPDAQSAARALVRLRFGCEAGAASDIEYPHGSGKYDQIIGRRQNYRSPTTDTDYAILAAEFEPYALVPASKIAEILSIHAGAPLVPNGGWSHITEPLPAFDFDSGDDWVKIAGSLEEAGHITFSDEALENSQNCFRLYRRRLMSQMRDLESAGISLADFISLAGEEPKTGTVYRSARDAFTKGDPHGTDQDYIFTVMKADEETVWLAVGSEGYKLSLSAPLLSGICYDRSGRLRRRRSLQEDGVYEKFRHYYSLYGSGHDLGCYHDYVDAPLYNDENT